MILWRVSNHATLDGMVGLYVGGRWHTKGHPIIYCAQNPATALLETLVHLEVNRENPPQRFQFLKIEGPDGLSIERIEPSLLGGRNNPDFTQAAGNRWLKERRSLLLEVPSVLVPETWNVLINPLHPEQGQLISTEIYHHPFDARLL